MFLRRRKVEDRITIEKATVINSFMDIFYNQLYTRIDLSLVLSFGYSSLTILKKNVDFFFAPILMEFI